MLDPLSSLAGTGQETSIEKLVSMYMAIERRPVDTLKVRKDELTVRTAMFNDLKSKLGVLKDLAEDLSTSTDSIFSQHAVASSDTSLASGTAYSSATNGSYKVTNVTLAQAHRVRSDQQVSGWTTGAAGEFSINGATISIDSGKSLVDLKNAINAATYESGREVVASIVDNTLILEAKSTGSAYAMTVADVTGGVLESVGLIDASGAFKSPALQVARDATFSVNGLQVTRPRNTSLDDVIGGVTFELKGSWAAGDEATIDVTSDAAGMRSKIDSFLSKLNDLMDYLKTKSSVTKDTSGNYTRGALSGYSLYTSLRSGFADDLMNEVTGLAADAPSMLSDLGIEMDENMHFVVKDSTKLDDLLETDASGVAAFFGGASGVAKRVFDRLAPYVDPVVTTDKSYVQQELDAITSEQDSLDDRIEGLNERLAQREETLRLQFTRLQALMIEAVQQQQNLNSIFSASSGWY
ncbi:MAG: flagellar filament capping protein FliD [Chloroflexota bacterium]